MVQDIYNEKINSLPLSKNILFDGNPKMLNEAKLVHRLLGKTNRKNVLFIYLGIPQKVVVSRVLARKGYDGTKFKDRLMDTVEALKNRAKYYKIDVKDTTEYFSEKYTHYKVSGLGTRTEVRAKLQKIIDKYLKTI